MFKKSIIITILILILSGGILVYASFLDKEEPVKPIDNTLSNNISESDDNNKDNQDQIDNIDNDISEIDNSNQKTYIIEEEKFDMSSKFLFIKDLGFTVPDTIYILDVLKSNNPIIIKTDILPIGRNPYTYKLLGDRIYFFNNRDKMVEWMDFEGNIHKLVFTKVDDYIYSNDFIVSSDDQKIVWVETNPWDETVKMNSKLMLAGLDGQNEKILLEKNFDCEEYFKPIKWSNSNEEIYFVNQPGGIGGYIIFGGTIGLSKINIYTGKLECLFKNGYIGDISPNEEFISYFRGGDNPKLIIRNMITDKENIFNIPIEENFRGGGDAHFSPDSKYLVYNIAHWDPDDEYFRTIVVNSTGKEQKTIIDDPQKGYEVIGWASNDKILLRNFGSIYIIDIDGSNLRKIEIANP